MTDDFGFAEPANLFECGDVALIGPSGATSIIETLNRLHQVLPPAQVADRGRIWIRLVGAICDPGQFSLETVAALTGCQEVPLPIFAQILTGTGRWAGETGVEALRAFLIATVVEGRYPKAQAAAQGMELDEYHTLNHAIGLEDWWHSTKTDRIAIAALTGGSIRQLRSLGSVSLLTAWKWQRWAKRIQRMFRTQQ